MTWADRLCRACAEKNFDISIWQSTLSNGLPGYSMESKQTFDNTLEFREGNKNEDGKIREWCIVNYDGVIACMFHNEKEAKKALHKGKYVEHIFVWESCVVAHTKGDYYNSIIKVPFKENA